MTRTELATGTEEERAKNRYAARRASAAAASIAPIAETQALSNAVAEALALRRRQLEKAARAATAT